MARESSSFKLFILLSCMSLFLQTGHAITESFNQQIPLPNPQKCVESFTNAGMCLVDLWTNFGKPPSKACCDALKKIEDTCWPALSTLLNPSFVPFLRGLCSAGGRGGFPFPPLLPFPFPFPSPGAGAGAHPPPAGGFPFPLPFPFPFPGAGGATPPPKAN